jgi:hypothetical protein
MSHRRRSGPVRRRFAESGMRENGSGFFAKIPLSTLKPITFMILDGFRPETLVIQERACSPSL